MKRTISLRPYIVATVLVLLAFLVTDYFLIGSIRSFFLERLSREYTNYAKIYSHSLTKSAQAYRNLNDTLEARLESALRTTALYADTTITNESLLALAGTLGVDEIYLYNPAGEIVLSTNEAYLGWQAVPGHPVYDFMVSGRLSLIEEIRQDSESDRFYKYGYFRLDDGRFVQLGITAQLVDELLSSFERERILEEISSFALVDYVCLVDPFFNVVAGRGTTQTDPEAVKQAVLGQALEGGRYSLTGQNLGGQVYEVYLPIYQGDELAWILVVGKSLKDAENLVRLGVVLSIIVSGFVFSAFLYMLLANYRHNKQLVGLAYQDQATGLPNRAHLKEVLSEALARGQGEGQAIMMVHCRNLGVVNSLYGYTIGDQLMVLVGQLLSDLAGETRQLFRFASNRFVFYIKDYLDRADLVQLADEVLAQVAKTIDLPGRQLDFKVGIVEITRAHHGPEEIFAQVTAALQHLENQESSSPWVFFDTQIEEALQRKETLVREMAEFLEDPTGATLYLHYQPKVKTDTGEIVGFEALARMNSPIYGFVSPAEFITLAERNELIEPFGYWALEEACRFIKELSDQGFAGLHVAVNISAMQLFCPLFPNRVREIMAKVGINPEQLQLEITESLVIQDVAEVQERLCPLRNLGVTIALDDFGTGYSALSRIEELPIDCIKVDKSFIDNILLKSEDTLILQELIAMCHKLGLEVVAEGVEEERQREYLAAAGCDIIQGYLFSKPLPAEAALEKLAS